MQKLWKMSLFLPYSQKAGRHKNDSLAPLKTGKNIFSDGKYIGEIILSSKKKL